MLYELVWILSVKKLKVIGRDNRPQSASLAKCPVLQSIPSKRTTVIFLPPKMYTIVYEKAVD